LAEPQRWSNLIAKIMRFHAGAVQSMKLTLLMATKLQYMKELQFVDMRQCMRSALNET